MTRVEGGGVIGAGLSRTGTVSLQRALEILGQGPVWHMMTLFDLDLRTHLATMRKWMEVGRLYRERQSGNDTNKEARQTLLREILQGYNSFLDVPAIIHLEDLLEVFPEKKVVLSIRDSPEVWFNSYEKAVLPFARPSPWKDLGVWANLKTTPIGVIQDRFHEQAWRFILPEHLERVELIQFYEEWNEKAKRLVPKDRLIIVNVKEGWGPLVDGLGVPTPSEPFPKCNDVAELDKLVVPVRIIGFLGLLLYAVLGYLVTRKVASLVRRRLAHKEKDE